MGWEVGVREDRGSVTIQSNFIAGILLICLLISRRIRTIHEAAGLGTRFRVRDNLINLPGENAALLLLERRLGSFPSDLRASGEVCCLSAPCKAGPEHESSAIAVLHSTKDQANPLWNPTLIRPNDPGRIESAIAANLEKRSKARANQSPCECATQDLRTFK